MISTIIADSLNDISWHTSTVVLGLASLFALGWLILHVHRALYPSKLYKGFPLVTGGQDELTPAMNWLLHGKEIIQKGFNSHDRPFQVQTAVGPMIVLQNRWAGEVKGEAKLSFNRSFCIDFHPTYSGFEAFKECLLHEQFITDIVLRLTQEWTAVTNRVLEEMTATIHDVCGDSTEWQEINLRSVSSSIIVRSISRVFVATDFSRDAGWLATAEGYTMNARNAALALDKWPAPLRFIAHRFNSASATIRQDYSRTQAMVRIELARRREEMSMARKAGKSLPKYDDALEYMNDLSVRRGIDLDHTAWLLALSIASLHTPIDALAHLLIDIADKPEVVQPLRDEIVETVSENGWRKAVYYKMKVMDSFLKESQRVHPAEDISMHRFVREDITLSDGTVLPGGSRFMVQDRLMDPDVYDEPEKFKLRRFVDKREMPDQSNSWQHATVSTFHMAFGYGHYACPGRFIASNVLKMALSNLLMKYDWKLADYEGPRSLDIETAQIIHPEMMLQLRRRTEEIKVDVPI